MDISAIFQNKTRFLHVVSKRVQDTRHQSENRGIWHTGAAPILLVQMGYYALMNATSRAIIETVLNSDSSLTLPERAAIRQLLSGGAAQPQSIGGAFLMTQKQAAEKLSVNRVTLWRLTRRGIFHLVEVTPGTWRYQSDEIQAYARLGYQSNESEPASVVAAAA
ncbi:helix-turn-helix domain-containing protein [Termitidicoccus mucosus]|uniref:helix-turn-helix transcriptional regulator n=1 Tax=Termitidicoccus mucosus TaxID=1184151 RepID=UPI002FEE5810